MIKEILSNKYFGWLINITYIIGLIVSIERGFWGWYFLITSILFLILYLKPLIAIMKLGSKMYVDFCRKTAHRINPYKDKEEENK